ncbi:ClbS/DfsB family four-helix bundle protein [Helicobacter sp. MIT 05-5294]|uniref:ClbS/DfsB family four-helix bundle protein n=1 Tax=Helicobacter sp. MIT 05-5294 TaxID=1548150 RepID=UPI0010FDAD32|nr:ClbS/DfsB family four-helix bundle protein [Helicobacter sp. MIT 05-5294]TLD85758.1 ClbS/DfsB family four-helix bundle protein [Helicobacter sp. MIT 05-5294]
MPCPNTKTDLLCQSQAHFEQLFMLIDSMPDARQTAKFDYNERDKTLRDILVHLLEWQKLLLHFVQTNLSKTTDFVPFLPAPYNFRTYPKMNQEIWHKHQKTSLDDAKTMLHKSHHDCIEMIEKLPENELFVKKHYAWCGTTSLGSYCVSATSSHYDWAIKTIKKALKSHK